MEQLEGLLGTTRDANPAGESGSERRESASIDGSGLEDSAGKVQRGIEQEEHVANAICLKQALDVAAVAWVCFIPLDWLLARESTGWSFVSYLACRIVGESSILGVRLLLIRAPNISEVGLRILDIFVFCQASALVSLMCAHSGGFHSPYAIGIPVIMMCRAAFAAQFWPDAIWSNVLTALMYPLTMLASALADPSLGGELVNSVSLTFGIIYSSGMACAAVFATMGGHARWSLRRQVFQARSVGRYRLVRKLGSGGMGEVWAADHRGLKRQVAIKILRSEARFDSAAIRRFEREAQAMSELSHPNTVRVFDFGVSAEGLWYYAMELLEGQDLGALVAKQGPLPAHRAVSMILQASRALAEAHARGIIHRDIKPENVFVTTAGGQADLVKVLDYGIAKFAHVGATLTDIAWVVGTPAYMSPEAAAGGAADTRSDVYSLGATLYFALTGRPPFLAANAVALLQAHVSQPPRPPSELLGEPVPPALEELVLRCLSKDPVLRHPDASALSEAIAELATGLARSGGATASGKLEVGVAGASAAQV